MIKLVSVIIPVYNAETTIAFTIQSIINQSYNNLEIIVVDDGSTDSTIKIIEELYDKLRIIRIFQQKKLGAAAARNFGIRVANGDYIQFMDSDDVLSTDKISNQILKLEKFNCDLIFCSTRTFKNNIDLLGYKHFPANDFIPFNDEIHSNDLIIELYGKRNLLMIQPNAFLLSKKLIVNVGFWNEELTLDDDGEYFARVILAARRVLFDRSSINYYRISNSNSLSKTSGYKAFLSAKKSLKSKLLIFNDQLQINDANQVSRNLISGFYYFYYSKYNKDKDFIEVEELLNLYGGFNRNFWPRTITRMTSYIIGNSLIFRIKLWISSRK